MKYNIYSQIPRNYHPGIVNNNKNNNNNNNNNNLELLSIEMDSFKRSTRDKIT